MVPASSTTLTIDQDFMCSISPLLCGSSATTVENEYDVALRADKDSWDMYLIDTYHLKYLPSNESEHEHFTQGSSYFEDVSI